MKTANFRLVSPLRVDCFFLPGVEFCETAANYQFWESVATASGATHLREKPTVGKLQYGSTASVDLPHDIALLKNTVTVPTDYVHAQFPHISVTHVQWQLCDFGVLLVESFLTVDIQGREAAEIEQDVQAAAAYVTSHAITENYNDLKNTIMSVEGYENFVVFQGETPVENAWASRALILDRENAGPEEYHFAEAWLANNKERKEIVEKLERGEIHHSADWMNYIYVKETPDNRAEMQETWKALLRAQFFYSAMGRIDSQLTEILSWAMSQSEDISTTKLREQLRQEMDFAEALLLKKSEVGKFVNPSSRQETERILDVWDFDDVLADPVSTKLQICQARIDNIENERRRSASFFTDLILMVIGVTSILGTALAVVSLGREASVDPNQTVYDLGAGDLTTWIATQPIDVILLISTIVSALMVLAFVFARKKSES